VTTRPKSSRPAVARRPIFGALASAWKKLWASRRARRVEPDPTGKRRSCHVTASRWFWWNHGETRRPVAGDSTTRRFVCGLPLLKRLWEQIQTFPAYESPSHRPRYYSRKRPRFQAFDTESRHGRLLCICSPDESHEYSRPETLLRWLWTRARDVNFVYNLSYERDVILKQYRRQLTPTAYEEHRIRTRRGYTIEWIGDKALVLKKGHHVKRFFDVAPFFSPDHNVSTLEEAAQAILGEGKLADVDRTRLGEEAGYYEAHREDVLRYCRRDAELTLRLAQALRETLRETFGFELLRYHSKASIAKAYLEASHPEVLDRSGHGWDRKRWYSEPFRASYRGGVFLCPILGRVENVMELDITSAYPNVIKDLPRLDRLRYGASNTFHLEARLGAYLVLVKYDGTLPLRLKGDQHTHYPVSERPHLYRASRPEMERLLSQGARVLVAHELFGLSEPQFSELPDTMAKRQALKRESRSNGDAADRKQRLLKIAMNALYGTFAEHEHGETPITNWVYAAHITASVRERIWALVRDIGRNRVLSIDTDSVRFVGDAPCPPGFEIKFKGATVTQYQSGVVLIEHPDGRTELRKRGRPWLTPEMLKNAKGDVLRGSRKKPLKLGEAFKQHRLDELGEFVEVDSSLALSSNLASMDYAGPLTFERFNAGPVFGWPPSYEDLTGPPISSGPRPKAAMRLVRELVRTFLRTMA
jgi:hypothetical protein